MEGSLKDKIKRQREYKTMIPEDELAKYFYHITCGLEYLHNQGIAHRDIKSDNILINKDDNLLIADIGLTEFVGDEASVSFKNDAGTFVYMAPEVFSRYLGRQYRMKKKELFKTDVWSLGVVMAELCLGPTINPQDNIFAKRQIDLSQLTKSFEGLKGYSNFLKELILKLLKHDPNDRLSLNDVRTQLERNYPNLSNDQKRENQNNLDTFIEELNRLNGQTISLDIISQKKILEQFKKEEIKLIRQTRQNVLNKFKENWNSMFKIETDFEKSLKIYKIHKPFEIDNSIGDAVLKDLSEQLVQVQKISFNYQLEHLAVDLSNCNEITDEGVKQVAKHIASNFGSIKQLKLYFSECKKITDNGIKELAQQIGYLQRLEQLNLLFTNCNKITDSSVQVLAQNIGNYLQYLQELCLDFRACTNITDEGFKALICSIIPNLKKLKNLDIDLSMIIQITDKEIEIISKTIESYFESQTPTVSLESLELGLSETNMNTGAHQILETLCGKFIPYIGLD